jgi:hypothetical protein
MPSAYLTSYSQGGWRSIACAAYPADFVPTRDRSLAQGSLFTYKSTREPEVMPTTHRRGFLKKYEGAVFGEIKGQQKLVIIIL